MPGDRERRPATAARTSSAAARRRGAGVGQPDDELLAPEAARHVLRAHALAEAIGEGAQRGVAGRVAVAVVERLEVVGVDIRTASAWPWRRPRLSSASSWRRTERRLGSAVSSS